MQCSSESLTTFSFLRDLENYVSNGSDSVAATYSYYSKGGTDIAIISRATGLRLDSRSVCYSNIMTNFSKTLLAFAILALASVPHAQATPVAVSGTINVGGLATFDSPSAGNATQVMGWYNANGAGAPTVNGAQGGFLNYVTPGSSTATFATPWNFNPTFGGLNPVVPAPSGMDFLSVGGITFYLTNWAIQSQYISSASTGKGGPVGSLTIAGSGYVSGANFLQTFGNWVFTTLDSPAGSQATFIFNAVPSGTVVPESGATVALLGLSLVGLGLARRRMLFAQRSRVGARA